MTRQYDHVTKDEVIAIQRESLAIYGGEDGIRDMGLLESALARPQQHQSYGDVNVFDVAALYCEAIIKNHPFIDGNKRCGFLVAFTFLHNNGYRFFTSEESIVTTILQVAMGKLSQQDLSQWFSDYSTPIESIA